MKHTDTYKTIEGRSEGLYKDKGSKFISLAFPVTNEDQIRDIIADIKKQYYDARHHCYAWALGQNRTRYRMNDDGEPSGTAGKPIYGQILSQDITNILIIVVRYFGGIKLGVRGLINAYKGAAQDALQNADIVTRIISDFYQIEFDYSEMNQIMKIIKDFNLDQHKHDFGLSCKIIFSARQEISPQVKQTFDKIPGISLNLIEPTQS